MKVAAYAPDFSACGYYRILIPLSYLHRYKLCEKIKIFARADFNAMDEYDIIIAQRETTPTMVQDLLKLQSMGKTIILDTDDLLEEVDPSNPAYNAYHPGSDRLNNYIKCLEFVDGITTTTYEMVQNCKKYNSNIQMIPNYIDFEMRNWPKQHTYQNGIIRIGWAGSSSHIKDLCVVGNVIHNILTKYNNVIYVGFGDKPLNDFMIKRFRWPEEQVSTIKPVPFESYPEQLVNFDIGLCPVTDTHFNRCKSHLKPLEYSASGIPFVASAVAPYVRYTDQGHDGFVAKTEQDWENYLSLMIEDMDMVRHMADNAREKSKKHDFKDHVGEYLTAWQNIIEKKPQELQDNQWFAPIKVGRNAPCPCGSGLKAKKCSCYPKYC